MLARGLGAAAAAAAAAVSGARTARPSATLGRRALTSLTQTPRTTSRTVLSREKGEDIMTEGQKRKAVTAMDEMSKDGKFQRTESQYRAWVKADGSTDFPAEKDRYVIYYSWACPWACRTLAVRALLGLQDVIDTIAVEPIMARTKPDDPEDQHIGWWFSDKRPDTINGCKHIRELYEKVDPQGKTTKFTVPVLFDKKQNKIVSNESSEIIRMLKEFNEFADKSAPFAGVDLYPDDLKKEIDAVNEWVYPMYNNGVYRSGFATSQEAYNEAVKEVWEALDRAEKILSEQRYLAGDRFTEADVRFFVTSVRFDEIYASHFKCTRRISESCPHVFEHLKEILQMPGVRDTVDIDDARTHYTCSHKKINPYSIIPISPFQAFSDKDFPECWYEVHMKPHNRDEKFPVKK